MNKTGVLFFPAFDWSLGETHPEREERLLYTRDQLFEEGLMDLPQFVEYTPVLAGKKDIARTHAVLPGPDEHVTAPHLIAAGGVLTLAKALMAGEISRGFAMVRPPGHHAMHTVYGNRGFCTINNVAIMVNFLRRTYGIKKIAIVDTDVHHGDGSHDIFYHDPDVLYISIHQDGRTLYPGSGFPDERGGPQAFDRTLNIPLPPGSGDEALLYVLEELVLPAIADFQPDLVLNSAGQDNHFTDPLANMRITAKGYGDLTRLLNADLAVLEGGYAIETALPYVNLGILLAMAGIDYANVEPNPCVTDTVPLRAIKPLVEAIKQRKKVSIPKQDWYVFHKDVFYDTDYIWEQRVEKIRGCRQCAGLQLIETGAGANRGAKLENLVIKLPFGVCPKCREIAEKTFALQKKALSYRMVYWQDQAADVYRYFDGKLREVVDEQPD
ncbi:MAG TPA: histone deacetylase [Desulfobacteria bacterium]|nr:histone deacetylase [Desulfobacteria bacterium]